MGETAFEVRIAESLQLVDPDSGVLRGRLREEGEGDTSGRTERVAPDAAVFWERVEQAAGSLTARRTRAADQALSSGLAIGAAGLNPVGLARPSAPLHRTASAGTDGGSGADGADRFEAHTGEGSELTIGGACESADETFGMCVQVTLPDPEMAVHISSGMAPYIPHLIALSASSPFRAGVDTGFDSFGTILRDRSPRAGLPPAITSAAEYEELVQVLQATTGRVHRPPVDWDVRPAPDVGGVEFRCMDACPRLGDVVALATCVRALALMLSDRAPPQPTGLELQLCRENRWRAARYGLDSRLFRLRPPTGGEWSAREAIRWLLERLAPLAERLGDRTALVETERILAEGNAATAMRNTRREQGSLAAVVHWLVRETAAVG